MAKLCTISTLKIVFMLQGVLIINFLCETNFVFFLNDPSGNFSLVLSGFNTH